MKCFKPIMLMLFLLGASFQLFSDYVWDYPDRPSYTEWCQIMEDLGEYDQVICDTIGTSVQNKLMHCLTITTNPEERGEKPKFQWTAGVHGNENSPIMNAPWMCDWLVNNYATNAKAKLILDSVIIMMVPLHNPDGCYANGNSNFGGERLNANGYDMNRNYPYPKNFPNLGTNPATVQKEVQIMMDFYDQHVFTMGWGWHSGFEGFSVPWTCIVLKHQDHQWYTYVSRNFIDVVQDEAANYSITSLQDNGYWDAYQDGMAWTDGGYNVLKGTGKDWVCYYSHSRGTCPEISNPQLLTSASDFQKYWDWTYEASLDYVLEMLNGIRGRVHVNGKGVRAQVFVNDHDEPVNNVDYHTYIFSDSTGNGCYTRMIYQGTYSVTYTVAAEDSPDGEEYDSTITGIVVQNGQKAHMDVFFESGVDITSEINKAQLADLKITPNNQGITMTLDNYTGKAKAEIYNASGKLVKTLVSTNNTISWNGVTNNGSRVSAGCYILYLQTAKNSLKKAFIIY